MNEVEKAEHHTGLNSLKIQSNQLIATLSATTICSTILTKIRPFKSKNRAWQRRIDKFVDSGLKKR